MKEAHDSFRFSRYIKQYHPECNATPNDPSGLTLIEGISRSLYIQYMKEAYGSFRFSRYIKKYNPECMATPNDPSGLILYKGISSSSFI